MAKYTYDEVKNFIESKGCILLSNEYKSNKQTLLIKCSCGVEFERSFSKFKNAKRYTCEVCSGNVLYDNKFVIDILETECKIKPKDKLFNSGNKSNFVCLVCGNELEGSTHNFIKNKEHPCYICNNNYIEYSYKGIKHYIENNSNCILLSDGYTKSSEKLKLKCDCGEVFYTSFSKFKNRNKRQCNKCTNTEKMTYDYVLKYISDTGNILLTTEIDYKNSRTPLKIKCKNCNKIFNIDFTNFKRLKNKMCSNCSFKIMGEERKYTQEYVENFIFENECKLLSKYKRANQYIDIECSCGEVFTTKFNEFNNGHKRQCNKCSKSISKGEIIFTECLQNNNIEFETQKSFEDLKFKNLLYFDFYFKELNVIVEINGIQHYEFNSHFHRNEEEFLIQQQKDSIKRNWCNENNIKLIEIKYTSVKDIYDWWDLFSKEVFQYD